MMAAELCCKLAAIFGDSQARQVFGLADAMGVFPSHARMWMAGEGLIPPHVAARVRAVEATPPRDRPERWLPWECRFGLHHRARLRHAYRKADAAPDRTLRDMIELHARQRARIRSQLLT